MTRYLHVANGTSTTSTIEQAGLAGATSIWADPLHEGPVPDVPDEELISIRARHLAGADHAADMVAVELRAWRAAIDASATYDELVLWYEHDLFDQLNLIQLLDRLATQRPRPPLVSLISIGTFPGHAAFKGLGELTPGELAPLFGTRQPVTEAQSSLAVRAWSAFRSADPAAVEALLGTDTSALPFLAAALARHLEEFPSTLEGLSRTERRVLELAASGPIDLRTAFPLMHEDEAAFYIADMSFLAVVRGLESGPVPLTLRRRAESGTSELSGTIELTREGRDVLAGRADRITLAGGIDRWLGGVHLSGVHPAWRWDGKRLSSRPAF